MKPVTTVQHLEPEGPTKLPQVRNTSTNPVPDVEHVLVTAGTGMPTSGIILGRDRG
jgi:hypothetical protein